MYLSEVFLQQEGTNLSEDSVRRGIKICEQNLNERLEHIPTSIGKSMYFLEKTEVDSEYPHTREIMDFWDVVREFAEEYQDFEIIKLAQSIRDFHKQNER